MLWPFGHYSPDFMLSEDLTPMSVQDIRIDDYDYLLPDERIARFPVAQRDEAKLLIYRKEGISHRIFRDLPEILPQGSMLIFNNTRVIHARLHLTTPTGARIEVLCLEPLVPVDYQQNFSSTEPVRWKALIGNNKRWKQGPLSLKTGAATLTVERIGRLEDTFEVEFRWDQTDISFGQLLAEAGIIPLPPYLKRDTTEADKERYQTIYAQIQGSVAAPTAGLHFTDQVFQQLDMIGVSRRFVTLHVGAGTFMPVKSDTIGGHYMHQETLRINRILVEELKAQKVAGKPLIAVGTTSTRLLESLYWFGTQLLDDPDFRPAGIDLGQWIPYTRKGKAPSPADSLAAILDWMHGQGVQHLEGQTQLIIAPGYTYRMLDGLITNFHQPKSTLLLLIAALIGEDWKQAYQYALEHDFRFLSFGDSSLLLP